MEQQSFSRFIQPILNSGSFNFYLKLGYVRAKHKVSAERRRWEEIWETTDPEHLDWEKEEPLTPHECLDNLLSTFIWSPDNECLILEEDRANGDMVFHLFGKDSYARSLDEAIWCWKDFSGGWAFPQRFSTDRIGGLLGYMVMKVGCVLRVRIWDFYGKYTQEDFFPWNKY